MRNLSIELDDNEGSKIDRYSCFCHKCNLAVKKAIKNCRGFLKDLSKLSKYTANIGKLTNKYAIFKLDTLDYAVKTQQDGLLHF